MNKVLVDTSVWISHWKKEDKKIVASENTGVKDPKQIYVPKLSESKLKDLSWSLGVSENENPLNKGDNQN